MKRIYNFQTVLPHILIGLLLIFVAYMGSAQIPESIVTSANDIGKSYTAGTRIITGLPKYFPDTVKNETLFAMDKNNNRLFTWNPKSSRWEVDKIRGNSSSTPRMEVLNSLVFDYTNTILQDSNNFKYYRWDLTNNIWNTGLNGSDTLTNYKVFTPTIANVLGYKEIYSGATLPASATIYQTGNKFLLTPDGTEYTYQGNHIWFSNIVKGTTTPSQTVTSGTETFDNSRAVWKNPNISVISGQTVDYIYRNIGWYSQKGFLDIRDFGADTLLANNSTAIQAAINYYSSIGGGTILIPEGTFIITSSLLLKSNVNIKGCGYGSVIKSNADAIIILNSQSTGVNNVKISDLILTSNAQTTDIFTGVKANIGVYFTNSKNITIDNVKCSKLGVINSTTLIIDNGFGGFGFFVESRYGNCENVLINNCVAEYIAGAGYNSGDGFLISGYNADLSIGGYNIKLTNCFAQYCGRHLYTIAGDPPQSLSANILFENCNGKEGALCGLDIEEGQYVTIKNCNFTKCGNSTYYYNSIATYGYNFRLLAGLAHGNLCNNLTVDGLTVTNSHYGFTFGAGDSLTLKNSIFDRNSNGDLVQILGSGFNHALIQNNEMRSDTSFAGFFNSNLYNNSLLKKNQFKGVVLFFTGNNIDFESNSFSKGFNIIGTNSNYLNFSHNKFLDYTGSAVYSILSNTCINCSFTYNDFLGTGNLVNGLNGGYHTYQNAIVSNNIFNGLGGAAFNSTNGDGFDNLKEFSHNTINSCSYGINFVQGSKDCIIIGNTVSNITNAFINVTNIGYLSHLNNFIISNNNLKASVTNGINFVQSTGVIKNTSIVNNNFSGVTTTPINSFSGTNNTIFNNLGSFKSNIIGSITVDANTSNTGNPLSLLGLQAGASTDSIVSSNAGVLRRLSAAQILNANAWSLTGNSGTTAGTNFLGTTDSIDLVLRTYNTEKVRVLATGNVGIGTASPAYKLDVNGSIGIGSNYIVSNNSSYIGAGSAISGGATTDLGFRAQNNMLFGIGTSPYLYLSNSGNFGVRTLTPSYSLDVNGTFNASSTANFGGKVGINNLSPAYKLDIDAKTASAGNPIRAQGLKIGAATDSILCDSLGLFRHLTAAQVVQNGITKTSVTSTFTVPSLGEYLIPFTLTGTTQASIVAATYIATDVTGCSFSIPFLAGDGTGTVKVINRTASAVTFTSLKVNFAVLSY